MLLKSVIFPNKIRFITLLYCSINHNTIFLDLKEQLFFEKSEVFFLTISKALPFNYPLFYIKPRVKPFLKKRENK